MPDKENYRLITHEQIQSAVSDGVEEAFTKLGIDTSEPFERQQDFAFLNKQRKESNDTARQIKGHVVRKGTDIAIVGMVIGLWQWLSNGGP